MGGGVHGVGGMARMSPEREGSALLGSEMNKYDVLVNGRNFLLAIVGALPPSGKVGLLGVTKLVGKYTASLRKHGFYMNVYVEADSPEEAETRAVALLRKDRKLRNLMMNEPGDQPRLYVEEITTLTSFRGCHRPRTGLGFYLERQRKKTIPTRRRSLPRVPLGN